MTVFGSTSYVAFAASQRADRSYLIEQSKCRKHVIHKPSLRVGLRFSLRLLLPGNQVIKQKI